MKTHLRDFTSRLKNPNLTSMRSIILAVLTTALAATLIFAALDINRQVMLLLGTAFLLTIILAFIGHDAAASWTALIAAFTALSYLIFINNGIRDTAMVGLITILIAAGLLAGKTGTLIIGIILIMEIGVYGALESQGGIVNQFSDKNFFADYLTLSIAVAVITTLQWLVISRLDKNIQSAQMEIIERKKVEGQLRDAEARYRNLVERIPLVAYISEPGQSGAWRYVSPQITNLTGYTPEEWTHDRDLWYSRIHPDDREHVVATETNALTEGGLVQLEYRLITRDGRLIWVYDESLLTLDGDHPSLVQGFLLDITSRKLAEEQLQMRVAELQTIHGVSETLIQKTDLQKLIHETGEQIRLTFIASNVLIAIHDPVTNLIQFPYDFQDNEMRRNQPIRFGEGMTTRIMEMKKPILIHKDWEKEVRELNAIFTNSIPIKSSVSVPIMSTEQVVGVITVENAEREFAFTENDVRLLSTIAANLAVAIENTRLQDSLKQELAIQAKLVSELEIKNEELERFAYTASHDLKSPLITIRGFLGYLQQDARAGNFDRLEMDIRRISDATEKMHRLLTELLNLSRVGRVMNEKEDIPFDDIVAEALKRVEGQLQERQISVRVGSAFPIVHADKERITEVVQNLVDNAAKFMGDQAKPQIEIDCELHGDEQTIFYVRDNGIGIRKEFQERIFGLFDKLSPTSDGSGVGLALVKRIVEVHGGKVWLESEEGSGATFYFTLGNG